MQGIEGDPRTLKTECMCEADAAILWEWEVDKMELSLKELCNWKTEVRRVRSPKFISHGKRCEGGKTRLWDYLDSVLHSLTNFAWLRLPCPESYRGYVLPGVELETRHFCSFRHIRRRRMIP